MSIRIPAPLHPSLAGIVPPPAPPAVPVVAAAPTPGSQTAPTRAAPLGLVFGGWNDAPAAPLVLGDRAYPGDASDPQAVAQAIVSLILEPS